MKKMVIYTVEVSPEFKEQLYKLPNVIQERVKKILNDLPNRNFKRDNQSLRNVGGLS